MQEDALLAGSIAENIAFFDLRADTQRIEECAKIAAVHEEIMAMPMGYATLIGDMGTAVSGGQKQRIVLARALYKQPKLLFLDEATSHLDVTREHRQRRRARPRADARDRRQPTADHRQRRPRDRARRQAHRPGLASGEPDARGGAAGGGGVCRPMNCAFRSGTRSTMATASWAQCNAR